MTRGDTHDTHSSCHRTRRPCSQATDIGQCCILTSVTRSCSVLDELRMLRLLKQTSLLLGAVIALLTAAGASDQPPFRLCEAAADDLKTDSDLADATRAAFGEPGSTKDETCLYPLQLLRYADVDVLVTQNAAPGTGCQTCEVDLSATVLKRIPGGFKRVRTFEAFGKTGGRAVVSSVSPIAIGGDDALAIESPAQTQGYMLAVLDLYAFRRQGLVHLDPGGNLYLAGDNAGAESDQSKVISIDSAWSLAGSELTVDYRISDGGTERSSRAVWSVGESRLTLKFGAPPKEMARAVGAE